MKKETHGRTKTNLCTLIKSHKIVTIKENIGDEVEMVDTMTEEENVVGHIGITEIGHIGTVEMLPRLHVFDAII